MMTSRQIKRRQNTIRKHIEKWNASLSLLQESCMHPYAVKKHYAGAGNWCKSDDRYWTEFKCPDCGKWWNVEGSV